MGFQSHNYQYQYETRAKACYYCRVPFAKISKYKNSMWKDNRVCHSCYLQAKNGVDMKPIALYTRSTTPITAPKLCKLCRKNKIFPLKIRSKDNTWTAMLNKYPHFCRPCAEKFAQMVKDDPKVATE